MSNMEGYPPNMEAMLVDEVASDKPKSNPDEEQLQELKLVDIQTDELEKRLEKINSQLLELAKELHPATEEHSEYFKTFHEVVKCLQQWLVVLGAMDTMGKKFQKLKE